MVALVFAMPEDAALWRSRRIRQQQDEGKVSIREFVMGNTNRMV